MTTPDQPLEPPPAGMTRIGRSPARTGLPLVALATVVGAPLLAGVTAQLVGNLAVGFPIALASWAVLLGGGIPAVLVAYYRPVGFDPVAGLARLGRATVPVSSVTAARREVSAGSRSTYLRYRFAATGGAWGRVLVAGRPMRGLRPADLALLEQFIAATAIAAPAASGSPLPQQAVADAIGVSGVSALQTYDAKRPVGKAELLAELRGELPAAVAGEAELPPLDTLRRQWERDDQAAGPVVLRSAADTVRRAIGWTVALAVAAGLGAVGFAAVRERSSATGRLDSDTNDVVGGVVLVAVAVGLVCYFGYAIASLLSTRHAQRTVLAWVRGRDDQQVARGLPPRLLVPFLGRPPAHRLRMVGGFAGCLVGGAGLLAGLVAGVATTVPETPGAVVAGLLIVGLVALWVGVVLFRRARRALRTQQQLAARLGGRRLAVQLTGAG